jgi:hypothetical protein
VSRQARKVYKWEHSWYHFSSQQFNKIGQARAWVRSALAAYDVPPTVVRARAGRESSFFRPHDWTIHFIEQHYNVATTLHEAAHAIYFYYYGDSDEPHNEKWLGIYVYLLTKTGLWPRAAIIASLEAAGLKYSKMMTPKALRRKKPVLDV